MADTENKFVPNAPGPFDVDDPSTATCAGRRRRPISRGGMTAVIPTFTSSPKRRRKRRSAARLCRVARSRPSAATAV